MRSLLLASFLAAAVAHADDFTPEQRAKLQNDQKRASAAVEKKYGNKKPSDLSADERRALAKEKSDAEREVLDKAGVDPKDFARSEARMTRQEKTATDAARKSLEEKDAAGEKDGAKKASGKKEVVVEKGGKGAADPTVNEAAEMDKQLGLGKGK